MADSARLGQQQQQLRLLAEEEEAPPYSASTDGKAGRKRRRTRVAIIGSGLAGLTAAHLLTCDEQASYDVHIFEKSDRIGYEAASIDFKGNDGKLYRVDSPMRAVQGGYYARLISLYRKLGIELQRTDFDYSFAKLSNQPRARRRRRDSSSVQQAYASKLSSSAVEPDTRVQNATSFIYNGGNGLSLRPFSFPDRQGARVTDNSDFDGKVPGRHMRTQFALHRWLYEGYQFAHDLARVILFATAYIYLLCISSYHYLASHLEPESDHFLARATFGHFLHAYWLPSSFSREILIPLFACVATCSPEELLDYPAALFLEYMVLTFGQLHYTVKGGVRNAIDKLLANIDRDEQVHLGCELVSLRRTRSSSTGRSSSNALQPEPFELELEDIHGHRWTFDHVIFATQANQARTLMRSSYCKLLQDEPDRDEKLVAFEQRRTDALSKFAYTHSIVVNHFDSSSVMGERQKDRRMLNIATWESSSASSSSSSCYEFDGAKKKEEKIAHTSMPRSYIMATHDLAVMYPNLCSEAGEALLQTTNPTVEIPLEKVVSRRTFERAIVTQESRTALRSFLSISGEAGEESYLASMDQITTRTKTTTQAGGLPDNFQGEQGIWFVGAWAAEGIPLLEGCVVSAERVVEGIRAKAATRVDM